MAQIMPLMQWFGSHLFPSILLSMRPMNFMNTNLCSLTGTVQIQVWVRVTKLNISTRGRSIKRYSRLDFIAKVSYPTQSLSRIFWSQPCDSSCQNQDPVVLTPIWNKNTRIAME